MLELLALLALLADPSRVALPAWPTLAKPSFHPAERALTNWPVQAALDLDVGADTGLKWVAGNVPESLPRCIRLNNYWCIKKAGWPGEVGADGEGHAAFASASKGAGAAVTLLRRYYLDYGRKSARAIVAHWAPAQCQVSVVSAVARPTKSRPAATLLGPLAKHGIRNTLRARWLAAHGRGGTIMSGGGRRKIAVRRSVVPDRLAPERPLSLEPPIRTETLRVAAVSPSLLTNRAAPPVAVLTLPEAAGPATICAGDNMRLANYAARAIEGIVRSPDEDLKLFAPDGTPLPGLRRLLANMAAVEIGPYRADGKLIDAALLGVGNSAPQ